MRYPFDKQPLFAYVSVSLGNQTITLLPPKHLVDFNFERMTDVKSGYAGSKFSLTVYDDTAIELEDILSNSKSQEIKFDYGYSGVSGSSISNTLTSNNRSVIGNVTEYSLTFEGGGTSSLSITGTAKSIVDSIGKKATVDYSAKDYKGVPSAIVRQIAKDNGWSIERIVETAPIKDDKGEPIAFKRNNQSPIEFINAKLTNGVVPLDNPDGVSSGYHFFLTESDKVVYEPVMETNPLAVEKRVAATYEYFSGRTDNTVISFSPEFKGWVAAASGGGNLASSTINEITNEMMEVSVTGSTYVGDVVDTSKYLKVYGMSSSTFSNLKNKTMSLWNTYAKRYYGATLEVLGDATVQVGTYIHILVLTKYGLPHHTSGVYYIKQVSDSISGGSFLTTMQLRKFGTCISKMDVKAATEAMKGSKGSTMEQANGKATKGKGASLSYAGSIHDIVETGMAKLGEVEPDGDNQFIDYYNENVGASFGNDVAWCAIFVTWCARNAGVSTDVIPNYADCDDGWAFFQKRGAYGIKGDYIPKRGDIFFLSTHTGIVVDCDGSTYTTIEGNYSDAVSTVTRDLDSSDLIGFGIPKYDVVIKA